MTDCDTSQGWRMRRAARLALRVAGAMALSLASGRAGATEFWETRLGGAFLLGSQTEYDLTAGLAFDTYITSNVGAMLGADLGLLAHLEEDSAPSDLTLSPQLSVWFGEDVPKRRPFITVRPVFGVVDLDGNGKSTFERLEVGPEYGLMQDDGGFRVRAGLFWAPFNPVGPDGLELGAALLRLSFGWAPPQRLPPRDDPVECLPCEPGCNLPC
ncbi:MAG TPA: hypothetical protein VF989_16495 [Polyangiaceae bacterium]